MLKRKLYAMLPFALASNIAFAAATEHLVVPTVTFQQSGKNIQFTGNIMEDTYTNIFPKVISPSIPMSLPVDKDYPPFYYDAAADNNGHVVMQVLRDDSSQYPSEFVLYDANHLMTYTLKQADGSDMPYAAHTLVSLASDGNNVIYFDTVHAGNPVKSFAIPAALDPSSSIVKVNLKDITLPPPANFPQSMPVAITYDAASGNWYVVWETYVYPSQGPANAEIVAYKSDANMNFVIQGQPMPVQNPQGFVNGDISHIIALPNQSFLINAADDSDDKNALELVTASGTTKLNLLDQKGRALKGDNPLNAAIDKEGNLYVAYQSGDGLTDSGIYTYVINDLYSESEVKARYSLVNVPIVSAIATVMEDH